MKKVMMILCMTYAIFLTGCGVTDIAYHLEIDAQNQKEYDAFVQAAKRVVKRRLIWLEEEKDVILEQYTAVDSTLRIKDLSTEKAKILTEKLTEPFSLYFMKECTLSEADVVIAETDGYCFTPVNQDAISSIESQEGENGTGEISLQFTTQGTKEMETLLKETQEKQLGLFLRGKLLATLTVTSTILPNNTLSIPGIMNKEVADIFADDVTVGIHVHFTSITD